MSHDDRAGTGEIVTVTHRDGVAEIGLNRPERRNALTVELVAALHDQLAAAESDRDVGAVMIFGAGNSLCSGLDLKDAAVKNVGRPWQRLHRAIARMSTPIVIAHEGPAINAGAALALSGDLLVAGETSFLQVMEAKIGMTPPVNLAWLLYRHSRALAARLTLGAERLVGSEILAAGIAHDVVADIDVLARARAVASQIATYPDQAATTIKALARRADDALDGGFDAVLDELTTT